VGHRSYPLSTHRWAGGVLAPVGHSWICSFSLEGSVPTWRYALGDALLEKRLWMRPGAHTTTVLYRLAQASQPVRLSLTALVNARSHHGGTTHPEITLQPVPRGVRMVPQVEGVPPYVVLSDRGTTTVAGSGEWCWGYALPAEEERGLPSGDDHLRASRVTVVLSPEEPTLTVVASTDPHPSLDGERELLERQASDAALLERWRAAQPELASAAPAWVERLVLAADQFVVARSSGGASEGGAPAGQTILAGYPWFGDWGRDTMISLPGLTLVTGRHAIAARILRAYGPFIKQGLLPNCFPAGRDTLAEGDYNTVDASLWYVEALRQYHQATGDGELIRELFPRLREIVEAYGQGTRHGIQRDPADGLLRAGEEGLQLTWMDAKVNGEVIPPRIGKPVEVNALWFRALGTMARFAELCGHRAGQAVVGGVRPAAAHPRGLAESGSPPSGLSRALRRRPRRPGSGLSPGHGVGLVVGALSPGLRPGASRSGGGPAVAGAVGPPLEHGGIGKHQRDLRWRRAISTRGCIAQAWSVAEALRTWVELRRWMGSSPPEWESALTRSAPRSDN